MLDDVERQRYTAGGMRDDGNLIARNLADENVPGRVSEVHADARGNLFNEVVNRRETSGYRHEQTEAEDNPQRCPNLVVFIAEHLPGVRGGHDADDDVPAQQEGRDDRQCCRVCGQGCPERAAHVARQNGVHPLPGDIVFRRFLKQIEHWASPHTYLLIYLLRLSAAQETRLTAYISA
jgi:hypothetical protein